MKRRKAIKTTLYTSAQLLLFTHLTSCKHGTKNDQSVEKTVLPELQFPPDASYQMKYINGNVGYFTERGGTIAWMAEKDHIVVVDTQFPDQSQHLISQMKSMQLGNFDLLINTHHHRDHTAGNISYKDLVTDVVAHTNSKINQRNAAEKRGNLEEQWLPNVTFDDTWERKVGSETIKMYHYGAAHTNGDAITHFENANVAHLGDLIFNRKYPYIDTSAGANVQNWITVLDKVLDTFDNETAFIFGHAGKGYQVEGGKGDIKSFINYLSNLLELGNTLIKKGMPLEEALQNVAQIPGATEWQGEGIERSINAIYAELAE